MRHLGRYQGVWCELHLRIFIWTLRFICEVPNLENKSGKASRGAILLTFLREKEARETARHPLSTVDFAELFRLDPHLVGIQQTHQFFLTLVSMWTIRIQSEDFRLKIPLENFAWKLQTVAFRMLSRFQIY